MIMSYVNIYDGEKVAKQGLDEITEALRERNKIEKEKIEVEREKLEFYKGTLGNGVVNC